MTAETSTPTPSASSAIPVSPSSNSLGSAMVVVWKVSPVSAVATPITSTSLSSVPEGWPHRPPTEGREGAAPMLRHCRQTAMNQSPMTSETAPGTMNAARQLIASLSDAATIAAAASPRLPATPLIPSSLPTFSRPSTSMAMPTGW